MKTSKFILSTILCLSVLVSCSSDDDAPSQPNEEEVITDVTLSFTNDADANDVVVLLSVDEDGEDGPLNPVQTITGHFTAGATYTATISLFNSIENEDITIEVTDVEPDEHFFIYTVNGLDMNFTRSTNDVERADGNKLGFETSWVANTASTGTIRVQLFHESESVDDSNEFGTQSGGSSDVDVTFTGVSIQ
ncbi:type 1 periplasmic binding fold superfamily protein [Psychroserpens algicola]|uniref:Type 1 periplasmic binding fold superfamily protein n=1 Tax=Psychroserpens algicola TaxID=1719034 RepID=A0ABT0H8I3_9FLAO|nr:type 1 periplasmic binding fold superfamily protein [Psychroserpens algicola]MCK8480677.1 type 1 periplasmic binding fold superfamily protein [Psychroserpens algicola]